MKKLLKACAKGIFLMVIGIVFWILCGEFFGIPIEKFWDLLAIVVTAYVIISFIFSLIFGDSK